ncbi:MAG: hypothetical protein RLZZ579_257, partial [Actinomycetota bacterium]
MPTLDEPRNGSFEPFNSAERQAPRSHHFNLYLAILEVSAAFFGLWCFDEFAEANYSGPMHLSVYLICAILTGAWAGQVLRDPTQGFVSSTRAVLLAIPGYALFDTGQQDSPSLTTLVASTAVLLPLLLCTRWLFRRFVITRRAKGSFLDGAVLVGTSEEVRSLSESISSNRSFGYKVVAVAALIAESERKTGSYDLQDSLQIRSIIDLAKTSGATSIFLGQEATRSSEDLEELIWGARAANIEIYLSRP